MHKTHYAAVGPKAIETGVLNVVEEVVDGRLQAATLKRNSTCGDLECAVLPGDPVCSSAKFQRGTRPRLRVVSLDIHVREKANMAALVVDSGLDGPGR